MKASPSALPAARSTRKSIESVDGAELFWSPMGLDEGLWGAARSRGILFRFYRQ